MTIEAILKKQQRKNIPVIVCEHSLQMYGMGLADGIDIKHKGKWHYGVRPALRHYDSYILLKSPKREAELYTYMAKRYYDDRHITDAI